MKNSFELGTMDREVVLSSCFNCLVDMGLEHSTMRAFVKATGMTSSSLYYRFKDKNQIVLESTYYGLKNITQSLFLVAVNNLDDFDNLFDAFFMESEKYKPGIKLIYQVANSPVYGDQLRELSKQLIPIYKKITILLAEKLNCAAESLEPFVDLFISSIREHIVWGNSDVTKRSLKFLYNGAMELTK